MPAVYLAGYAMSHIVDILLAYGTIPENSGSNTSNCIRTAIALGPGPAVAHTRHYQHAMNAAGITQ